MYMFLMLIHKFTLMIQTNKILYICVRTLACLVLCGLVLVGPFVRAQDGANVDTQKTLLLHLYYNNGTLSFDRDFPNHYEVQTTNEFDDAQDLTQKQFFTVKINSVTNQELSSTFFIPTDYFDTDASSGSGKVSLPLPYFPAATSVHILDENQTEVLLLDITRTSACNDLKQCQPPANEPFITCIGNCSTQPANPSPSMNGKSIWTIILIVLSAVLALTFIIWTIIKRRNSSEK